MPISWDNDCIPRELMPQVNMVDLAGLEAFFLAHGLHVELLEEVSLGVIGMKQCRGDTHAATLTEELMKKPLIISQDYKLVDGNGRFLAYEERGIRNVPALWVPTSFQNTVLLMMQYPKTYTLFEGIQPCRI